MAPEGLPVFTGTTPKPSFYDSKQPQNHTKEKGEGREEREEKKRTPGTHNFYIAYFGDSSVLIDKKALATHRLSHLDRGVSFSKIQVDIKV